MLEYERRHNEIENRLNKIVNALTGGRVADNNSSKETSNINFCVEETLTPADIKVTVKGVGNLSFPLSKADVQKLIDISSTAKFGMGEETVVDKNVRNTQMIEAKMLNVTIKPETLTRITRNMQKALSLSANSTLTPHLHNMLIYGPGQFFKKHRDSEKLQNMVATLVIILPSPHIGGDLIIEHGRKKHTFSSENVDEDNAKCICFYSDCLHKVNKVKCGYRVALTFNVVLETGEPVADTSCSNKELKTAVQEYFNAAVEHDRSKKIVFFLNHKYSEHSLDWSLLKGEDCQYASSFRSVARELNLDVHLVLANIHQLWASESEYRAKPDWLVETNSDLNFWVDVNNVKLPYSEYSTTRSEICYIVETHYKNFNPTEEDFSGPTGNEGATIDYWYKRAAVVLWQKSDSIMIKFELNYDEALSELRTLISVSGNEKKVKEILDKAAGLLHKDHPSMTKNFETFANIALYSKSKKKALIILSPFKPNVLIPKNIQMLVQLQKQYGTDWLIELLGVWLRENHRGYFSDSISSETIYPFVCGFMNSGGDRSVIEFLLKIEVTTFIEKSAKYGAPFIYGKAEVLEKLRELFKACAAIGNAVLQEELVLYVTVTESKLFPKNELIKLYRQLQKNSSSDSSENFELLRSRLTEAIKQELSSTRQVDDWSILTDLTCSCEHCKILTSFLRSKTDMRKSWPAIGNVRKHIMSILKRSQAPVDVTIESEKKPFTMVLVKSAKLHVEAAEKCTGLKKMLQTLEPKTTSKPKRPLKKNDSGKRQKI